MQATRFNLGSFSRPFKRERGETIGDVYKKAGQIIRTILNAAHNVTPFFIFDLRELCYKSIESREIDDRILGCTLFDGVECGYHFFRIRDNWNTNPTRAIDEAIRFFNFSEFQGMLADDPGSKRTVVRELRIQGFPHLTLDYVCLPLTDSKVTDQYATAR